MSSAASGRHAPLVSAQWMRFLGMIGTKHDRTWIFRGEADASWQLRPGAGRPDKLGAKQYRLQDEKSVFQEFMMELPRFHELSSDIERLAVAQHHGLPTRLLDWSTNPLVAAWFACRDENNTADGRIYMLRIDKEQVSSWAAVDPFKLNADVVLVRVPPLAARITAQQGLFTAHNAPTDVWDVNAMKPTGVVDVETIVIPAADKDYFRQMLSVLGVSVSRLMGDLDSVCSELARNYRDR